MLLLEYKPRNKFKDLLEEVKKQEEKDRFLGYMGISKDTKDRKREFWGKMHCKYIMTNRKLLGFAHIDLSTLTQYGKFKVKSLLVLNKPESKKEKQESTLRLFNSIIARRK
jgi:hypothetical protein